MVKRLVITIAIVLCICQSAYPLEYLLGVKVWYSTWRPYFKDMGKEIPVEGWQYIEGGSGVMYGPSCSVLFTDDLSFSISYLYGKLYSSYDAAFIYEDRLYDYAGSIETTRHDLDAALSYRISSPVKLFAGFKYQPITVLAKKNGAHWDLTDGAPNGSGRYIDAEITFRQKNYAPAIGIGYTFVPDERIALSANVSALYFRGTQKVTGDTDWYDIAAWAGGPNTSEFSVDIDTRGWGINAEPNMLVTITPASYLLLGYRLQYLSVTGKGKTGSDDIEISGMKDVLHGVYLALLYRI